MDVGDGHLVASFAASRPALLSVTCYHPEHGVAELSAVPAFDERQRGDPDAVRRYRAALAGDDFPCLWLESSGGQSESSDWADTSDTGRPRWREAEARADAGAIVVSWPVADEHTSPARLRFRGRLDRPALAEITELDPPRPTGAITSLHAEGSRLVVRSTLPAAMAIDAGAGEWAVDGDEASLEIPAGAALSVRIKSLDDLPQGRARARGQPADDSIVARALAYTRNCAAINTGPDEVVMLADHRLLPLSWTRDAYYQALLLLSTNEPADIDLVADHLRWLWRRCERPGGRWLRSHYANGRPKDLAFQADQQLYPMIELADFWRATGKLPRGVDWEAQVPRAWQAAMAKVDPETGLMATTENAADDPVAAPFVAASQILLWYTATRLAELADRGLIGPAAEGLRDTASVVRRAFDRYIAVEDAWLYATDTRATHVRYHDANDLPVALAPLLGFCAADDPGWRATMDFAFSEASPGYFTGERGGLGSAHTPMPWTLGDIQGWIRARILGDHAGMSAATERLAEVAFHDGMLPEAYSATRDPDTRVRHWFAWPGAAYGALVLLDARGQLDWLGTR